MKRLFLWIREFSLSQQLFLIVFLIITVFTTYLFAFLTPEVDRFTKNEMYRMLHISQTNLEYYLLNNEGIYIPSDINGESEFIQGIYNQNTGQFMVFGEGEFSDAAKEDIRRKAPTVKKTVQDFQFVEYDQFSQTEILYSMKQITDYQYLISMLPSSYEVQFRNLLINNVVNINIVIVFLLFLFLMFWIATIIHSLNQIKIYIKKIQNDEPAQLSFHRRDEIGEVGEALILMNDELIKQNREKQEMIQNISHDLKTPIATIKSYGESIKDGIYPYGSLEKSIDVIVEHASRLEKKVKSLIALNKMEYLLDNAEDGETLQMNQVIDKVLLSLKVIRPEISFDVQMKKDVYFHGEEDPWRIVVENLIDNALRYAKSKITIILNDDELIIQNDGKQIDPATMEKMFKPYEKGTDGQFGLGLSIVYKVVTTYNYRVEPDNLADGVMFRIWKERSMKELKKIQKEKKNREK